MTAATTASPMPVFPLVGSTRVEPARSAPRRSASSIIDRAMRSFTLPPGFWDSTLARIVALPARAIRARRTSGVFPMRSSTLSAIRGRPVIGSGLMAQMW